MIIVSSIIHTKIGKILVEFFNTNLMKQHVFNCIRCQKEMVAEFQLLDFKKELQIAVLILEFYQLYI